MNNETVNMTEDYYDYLMDTFTDIISDLATHIPYLDAGVEMSHDKGKLDAYMDIMHMINDDYEKGFSGNGKN